MTTTLPLLARGKVRELYELGDDLLMVASDRISTYDAVHPTPIPDKGKVLTGLSVLWFDLTEDVIPNHLISATDGVPDDVRGRALRVRRLTMLPVECIVRGYITGSAWSEYKKHGTVHGMPMPAGLQESQRLEKPIWTPSTKAEQGEHDENISRDKAVEIVGESVAKRVEEASLVIYEKVGLCSNCQFIFHVTDSH